MIFETELDEDGEEHLKKLSYNKRDSYVFNMIKPSLFPELSSSQKKNLESINHFFKENLFLKLSNFGTPHSDIKNETFDNINFELLFKGYFSHILNLVKDVFFVNEKGELVNRYDGFLLKLDNSDTPHIHFEKLPDHRFYWKEQCERRFKPRPRKGINFNIREYINIRPYESMSIDIKRQFLYHTGSMFKTDKYPMNIPVFAEKIFNDLNKDGYLKNINNFSDFKKEYLFLKKEYYKEENFWFDSIDYVLNEKEFVHLNEGNIFNFFDNRMKGLFFKEDAKIFSLITKDNKSVCIDDDFKLASPKTDAFITPEYFEEIKKIVNVYTQIQKHIYIESRLFDINSYYLFDIDRGFKYNNKNHRVHNLTYNDFLNYYKMENNKMNLCFFHYMYEFSLIDEIVKNYIEETILSFTHDNEKVKKMLFENDNKYINLSDLNEKIKYPLNIIEGLCDEENRELFEIIVEIHKKDQKKFIEYDSNLDTNIKKLFHYTTEKNNNEFLFNKLEIEFFNSSENIISVITFIKHLFKSKGECLSSKIDLPEYIKKRIDLEEEKELEDQSPMNWIRSLVCERKKDMVTKNREDSKLVDFVCDKLFILFTGEEVTTNQEEIIKNLIWIEKEFPFLNKEKTICLKRNIPLFNEKENFRIKNRSEKIEVMNLLDYHLLKGHDEVVHYLKSKGFIPEKKVEGVTSLEYAVIGLCENNIIDWVCEKLEVSPGQKVNVFGFLRYPLSTRSIHDSDMTNHTLLNSVAGICFCFFNHHLHLNDEVNYALNDDAVLKKMSYVYNKYKVDFSKNAERVYYLLNDQNESLLKYDLNLSYDFVEQIKYSLFIKDLIFKMDIESLKKEIIDHRLTLDMNLIHNMMNNKDFSGVLNLLYIKSRYETKEQDIKFLEEFVTFMLDNVYKEKTDVVKNIKSYNDLNFFEILMSDDVYKHRNLIKKLVVDYGFDLKSGRYIVDKDSQEKVFENYKKIYFNKNSYTENLYHLLVSQCEKEKIEKNMDIDKVFENKKRRM